MPDQFIPFHQPYMDDSEVNEVVETIRSGWWTTGPKALEFEKKFNSYIGSTYSVAVSSWTAAAHLALEAVGLKKGDEVIIPAFTFTATAEIICYFGAKPVIVDVQKDTFNIDPVLIEKAITNKTKAIIPVHFGGQPCDMDEIKEIASKHSLNIIEDAAHALPAKYKDMKIGTIGDVTCFSFYATKTLATGEGGMLCTDNIDIAKRASIMRLHGINSDAWNRYSSEGSWYYEVIAPGYKYNLTDIQASLGLAQLRKIDLMHKLRKEIYDRYQDKFNSNELINLCKIKDNRESAYHLYPILLNIERLRITRAEFISELKNSKIGASVHFIPLYMHPYYKNLLQLSKEDFPVSDFLYERIISLPIWPGMKTSQIDKVIEVVSTLLKKFSK